MSTDAPGWMERVFWSLLERAGPRLRHDRSIARDLAWLIHEGRIGDAYITAIQYDLYEEILERKAASVRGDPPAGQPGHEQQHEEHP